ncbi:LacI family DNA-binding transcriptional regulator [Thermocatellispora tengchongensis]|uniref:LacI family DNA-binding transcriptional regulator n=1 Tax=Thermocatellispora tengchongensis TaxID=1073253 RepID=UPI00363E80C8
MATIGDVAREAGVSRSTASYALSGKRPISEEVRRRVLAAAEALASHRTRAPARWPPPRPRSSVCSPSSTKTSSRPR